MSLCDSCKKAPTCPVAAFYRDEGRTVRECAVADVVDNITAKDTELRRLRISQLRRMADACKTLFSRAIETSERRAPEFPPAERIIAINARIRRFRAACLAEIERLRALS